MIQVLFVEQNIANLLLKGTIFVLYYSVLEIYFVKDCKNEL